MAVVNGVLGPINTDSLGFTLSHEHVLVTSAGLQHVYPEFIDRDGTIHRASEDLKEANAAGIDSIVDVTTLDLGRDVRLLRTVSESSGVNIVCATGTWLDIPRAFWNADPDDVARLYIREIEEGIEGTGVKAGIIKVAHDKGGVSPAGEVTLRAAARAHKATGAPISTHAWAPEQVGLQQLGILDEEGVDPSRVYIGHSNDTTDLAYLDAVAEAGAWIGLDRYPGSKTSETPGWLERTETLKRLIDRGHSERLMLGHDWSVEILIGPRAERDADNSYNPDSYLFITRQVLPKLLEWGVPQDTIDQMMVHNPRRFFEGA